MIQESINNNRRRKTIQLNQLYFTDLFDLFAQKMDVSIEHTLFIGYSEKIKIIPLGALILII